MLSSSILRNKRNGGENRCSLPWLGIDRKTPAYQVNPLLHTQQSQSSINRRLFHIESDTCIVLDKLNLVFFTNQTDCELVHATVLYGIM